MKSKEKSTNEKIKALINEKTEEEISQLLKQSQEELYDLNESIAQLEKKIASALIHSEYYKFAKRSSGNLVCIIRDQRRCELLKNQRLYLDALWEIFKKRMKEQFEVKDLHYQSHVLEVDL